MMTKTFKAYSSKRRQNPSSEGPGIIPVAQQFTNVNGLQYNDYNYLYQNSSVNAAVLTGSVMNDYNFNNWGNVQCACGFAFGTGTTAPTENDYFVESYVADFTYGSSTFRAVNQTDQYGVYDEVLASYTYTGSSDVTITEVGYVGKFRSSSGSLDIILIDRSLLNPGVTLHQGEAITISLKLYHTGAIALS